MKLLLVLDVVVCRALLGTEITSFWGTVLNRGRKRPDRHFNRRMIVFSFRAAVSSLYTVDVGKDVNNGV